MKRYLIFGISGQDGSIMARHILNTSQDFVYGVVRRSSNPNHGNFSDILNHPKFKLLFGDLSDSQSIENLVTEIQPDYLINFGAMSFVKVSWDIPEQTMDVNAIGVLRCLEAVRKHCPKCRVYSAGSSEQWGDVKYSPQNISHPESPRSIYGVSKTAAKYIVKVYRESYGIFAIHSILTNHESPARGPEFVTRKITLGVARILAAIKTKKPFKPIELGNVNASRDWSHSLDFCKGILLMLNQKIPKEYVLSSNETHTVREFVELAFKEAGIEGAWTGNGVNEQYCIANYIAEEYDVRSSVLVKINPEFYRPAEVDLLLGDSTPARKELGWQPEYSFKDLVREMVTSDIANFKPDSV